MSLALGMSKTRPSNLLSAEAEHALSKLTIDKEAAVRRSEEHTSELQSLMRISYAVFCLKKKTTNENLISRYNRNTDRISTKREQWQKKQNTRRHYNNKS